MNLTRKKRIRLLTASVALLALGVGAGISQGAERKLPVVVTGEVAGGIVEYGSEIPLVVTIQNGFSSAIYLKSFDLAASASNGETPSISLYDIYRGSRGEGLYMGRPSVTRRDPVMPLHRIEPGESISITTHVDKWTIADGWIPGRYRMDLRIDNLQIDGFSALSVLGEPVEFEIREIQRASLD